MIAHGRGVYRPGGGCRDLSVMAAGVRHGRQLCFARVKQERVQMHRPSGVCMLMHARAQSKTRGNPDRGTRVPGTKSCVRALIVPSVQPPKSECERAARRPPAKRRRRPTFFAIVLASSSNMTRARSVAVVGVGLRTACLGLDCHKFSCKPAHTDSWSTRFLPGHMFPVKAQTITAVARVLKRWERARLRLAAHSATRCVPRGWACRWAQTQRCGADMRSLSPASSAVFLRARISSLSSRW